MNALAITNLADARAARSSMREFLDSTKPVTKPPNGVFRSEVKAGAHVWARQYARSEGSGYLDNAISRLQRGTAGPWTDETVRLLRADRAAIGDGLAPTLVGDVRAHVTTALDELDSAIQARQPGPLRLLGIGAGIAAVAGIGLLLAHDE